MLRKLLIFIIPFLTFAQQPFNMTAEAEHFMVIDNQGFSIGNACDEPYMLVDIDYLDMNFNTLEVMRSHIIIYDNVQNEGTIIYKCDDSILEIRGGTLNVADPQPAQELLVWPVPATREINIAGIEVTNLKLYDLTGRLLKHYTTFGQLHRIIIEDLAQGVYIVVINNEIKRKIVKI